MDPNTPPTIQPTATAEATSAIPATPEVPTSTPTSEAPEQHKKSFLDSIMSMFGMGPKEQSPADATAAPTETPAPEALAPTPTQQ